MILTALRLIATWSVGLAALVALFVVLLLATDIAADVVIRGR